MFCCIVEFPSLFPSFSVKHPVKFHLGLSMTIDEFNAYNMSVKESLSEILSIEMDFIDLRTTTSVRRRLSLLTVQVIVHTTDEDQIFFKISNDFFTSRLGAKISSKTGLSVEVTLPDMSPTTRHTTCPTSSPSGLPSSVPYDHPS